MGKESIILGLILILIGEILYFYKAPVYIPIIFFIFGFFLIVFRNVSDKTKEQKNKRRKNKKK